MNFQAMREQGDTIIKLLQQIEDIADDVGAIKRK
jgi:hypothetical protein